MAHLRDRKKVDKPLETIRSILKVPIVGSIVLRLHGPLSDVLSLLKPRSYISGGFVVGGDMAIQFPKHQGIKCYAVLAGQCWAVCRKRSRPVLLTAGDCFLLPRGLSFCLATDLSLKPVHFHTLLCSPEDGSAPSPAVKVRIAILSAAIFF